jgi:hypothetical protein
VNHDSQGGRLSHPESSRKGPFTSSMRFSEPVLSARLVTRVHFLYRRARPKACGNLSLPGGQDFCSAPWRAILQETD